MRLGFVTRQAALQVCACAPRDFLQQSGLVIPKEQPRHGEI
jgi:hypothetical protein